MAVRFQYDRAQQVLWITFEGDLDDAQLTKTYEHGRKIVPRLELRGAMLDGRGLKSIDVTSAAIMRIAQMPPLVPEESDRAIVVDQTLAFGLARMYQILGGESRERLRVCRTLDEAYEYLKIEAPTQLEDLDQF